MSPPSHVPEGFAATCAGFTVLSDHGQVSCAGSGPAARWSKGSYLHVGVIVGVLGPRRQHMCPDDDPLDQWFVCRPLVSPPKAKRRSLPLRTLNSARCRVLQRLNIRQVLAPTCRALVDLFAGGKPSHATNPRDSFASFTHGLPVSGHQFEQQVQAQACRSIARRYLTRIDHQNNTHRAQSW